MPTKLISCVISCYNEEKNIAILLDQIKSNNLEKNFEFIIVNNGSTDNSWKIICEKKNNFPEIKFINLDKDLGWGNGITEGLKHTLCEFVGWTHGDLQTPIKDVIKIFKNVNGEKNIFGKGYRVNIRGFDGIIISLNSSMLF